jgi:hypothetical protein
MQPAGHTQFYTTLTDATSRGNGFADGGVVGLFMICLLWPWVPLLAAPKAFAHNDDE